MIRRKRTLAPARKRIRELTEDEQRAAIHAEYPKAPEVPADLYNAKVTQLMGIIAEGKYWRSAMRKIERDFRRVDRGLPLLD